MLFFDCNRNLLYFCMVLNTIKMISREVLDNLRSYMFTGKALVLLGARQVGKTTLIKLLLENRPEKIITFIGDDADTRSILEDPTAIKLQNFIGDNTIVVIDEAQRIKNIGITAKIIIDQLPQVQLIISGSSSLELANEINEPLTGRRFDYQIFPLSTNELINQFGLLDELRNLNHRLVYGSYPEVVTSKGKEQSLLSHIAGSYLYKDLLAYEKIKKPGILDKLVRALALQIGNEVSYNEISQLIGIDKETVEKYIDLLEKAFVIFKLDAFSRNVRNEIKKGKKVYFYDNGIRNAIIGNYSPAELRSDVGALWENFVISERQKYNARRNFYGSCYFWRTTQQQKIDYVEEIDGKLHAFEAKWNPLKKVRFPKTFMDAYDIAETKVITPDNYYEFLR